MSYVRSTLAPNERILAHARFHWSYTALALLWLAAGLAASIWLWVRYVNGVPSGLDWLLLAPAAVGAFICARMLLNKATTEIAVTDQRIVCKQGLIARRTTELPLIRIEEINVRQGILGRILGYGRVHISGTGGDTPLDIPTIDDPVTFRRAIPAIKGNGGI